MDETIFITPGNAKKLISKAVNRFTGNKGFAVRYLVDEDNREKMLIFYDPGEDYCVNVQITNNLHANNRWYRSYKPINSQPIGSLWYLDRDGKMISMDEDSLVLFEFNLDDFDPVKLSIEEMRKM